MEGKQIKRYMDKLRQELRKSIPVTVVRLRPDEVQLSITVNGATTLSDCEDTALGRQQGLAELAAWVGVNADDCFLTEAE